MIDRTFNLTLILLLSALAFLSGQLFAAPDAAVKSVTFDDVKLELKKGDPYDPTALTPKVKELDGTAIRNPCRAIIEDSLAAGSTGSPQDLLCRIFCLLI